VSRLALRTTSPPGRDLVADAAEREVRAEGPALGFEPHHGKRRVDGSHQGFEAQDVAGYADPHDAQAFASAERADV
jgi:hypothetical protein